ncbi:MAG: ribosomal protein S18-alanine N-acetyltransferase [Rhodocyclaceae bacterium]
MNAPDRAGHSIGPMRTEDLDAVLAIERLGHPFPWTAGNFADCLAAGHGAWVLRSRGEAVGHAVMMYAPEEAHLLNITVAPRLWRRGLGRMLMEYLLSVARAGGALRMLLEVRASNSAGIALYRDCGFEAIGVRRAYYPADGGREDAIVMERML